MNILRLAWHYLRFHKAKTAILVACIGLTIYLPVTSQWLVGEFEARMGARARVSGETPLVIGMRGGRFDLVLHALNFRSVPEGSEFGAAELDRLRADGHSTAIPLYIRDHAAKGSRGPRFPIVGTSPDYLELRQLQFAQGGPMTLLGDCVLGAEAARELGAAVGDSVQPSLDMGLEANEMANVPVRLKVVGVLVPAHTADDSAVFTGLKTAWIVAGHGHGHDPGEEHNAALLVDDHINADNLAHFHFHLPPEKLPLTAIIALPRSRDAAIQQEGMDRYLRPEAPLQVLAPERVVGELIEVVFQAKRFVDANQVAVAICTKLFVALVVWLSVRLRREELETLYQMGCARLQIFWMITSELAFIMILSTALALSGAWWTANYVEGLVKGMGF